MFRCEEVSMKTMGRHFYANERLYLTYSGSEVGFFREIIWKWMSIQIK